MGNFKGTPGEISEDFFLRISREMPWAAVGEISDFF